MTKKTATGVIHSMSASEQRLRRKETASNGETKGVGRDLGFQMPRDAWLRLFLQAREGRPEAVEALYDAAAHRLFGLALWRTGSPDDASDVVQEVFVRLVRERHRLDRVVDPRAWLLTVTHRAAVDVTRRRRRRPTQPLADHPFLAAPARDAERTLDAKRASAHLGRLPPAQREVIYLHHFAELTFAAIGRILSVPTFTAASRYRLGLKKLRRFMEGKP